MSITVIYHAMSLTVLYQYHYEEWCVRHSDLSCYVSDCTVSISLRRVICLSQWFIMLCLWLYCINITMKSDMSVTVIYHATFLCLWLYCINITSKSDTSITVIYHAMSLIVLYQYHYEEWYVCHSDLSCYVSDCTVSISLRRVICLSQWFIKLCLLTMLCPCQ